MSARLKYSGASAVAAFPSVGPQGAQGYRGTPGGPQGPAGPQGPTGDVQFPLDIDCSNIIDVSGIYFCNGTAITSFPSNALTISGSLGIDNYSIYDVSQITFSDGTTFGEGSSFDINANQNKLEFYLQDTSMGNFSAPAAGEFLKGLNVNFGIRRLSTTNNGAEYAWEDGFMGNSSQMVFTAADFVLNTGTNYNISVRQDISINDLQITMGSRFGNQFYGAVTQTGKIVCQKVIPKGFTIDSNSEIRIYTPNGNYTGTTVIVSHFTLGNTDIVGLLNTATYTTNDTVSFTGPSPANAYGDGLTMLNIYLERGVGWTWTTKPAGITVTMKRY